MSSGKEERLDRRQVFAGKFLQLVLDSVRKQDGSPATREVVLHPGGVVILPLLQDGRVLLVEQFRYPVGELLWELPAGKLDRDGEPPLTCAKRELREETGYEAATWEERLTFYTSPGFTDERLTLFVARDLRRVGMPRPQEIATCRAFTTDEINCQIAAGKIRDAKTILGILLLGR